MPRLGRLFVQSAQWSLSRMSTTSLEVLDKTGPWFESAGVNSVAAPVVYLRSSPCLVSDWAIRGIK